MTGRSSASSPETAARAHTGPSVWLARQPDPPAPAGEEHWLLADEKARLGAFSGTAREEFLHSRWLIRHAVGAASGHAPALCAPLPQRPVRTAGPEHWPLSLSHSHGLAACATGPVGAIGVDLEPLSRRSDWQRIARRWFTGTEQQWLMKADTATDFLRLWTLKEAWLKATGRGIAGNLKTLEMQADGALTGELPGHRQGTHWHAWVADQEGYLLTVVCQFLSADQVQPPWIHQLECRQATLDTQACAAVGHHQQWHFHQPIHIRSET